MRWWSAEQGKGPLKLLDQIRDFLGAGRLESMETHLVGLGQGEAEGMAHGPAPDHRGALLVKKAVLPFAAEGWRHFPLLYEGLTPAPERGLGAHEVQGKGLKVSSARFRGGVHEVVELGGFPVSCAALWEGRLGFLVPEGRQQPILGGAILGSQGNWGQLLEGGILVIAFKDPSMAFLQGYWGRSCQEDQGE